MDERISNGILIDFTFISLITLVIGLSIHAIRKRFIKSESALIQTRGNVDTRHFAWIDFLFIPFLLGLFLWPFVYLHFNPESIPKPDQDTETSLSVETALMGIIWTSLICGIALFFMSIGSILQNGKVNFLEIFGLKRLRFRWVILWITLGFVISTVSVMYLSETSSALLESLFGEVESQKPVEHFRNAKSLLIKILLIISACVVAPIVEEIVFRGYVYPVFKRFSEPMFAALISGAFFAVAHGNLHALMPLWAFAICLTLAYEATGSLWVPIGMHSLFNGFNVMMILGGKAAENAG